MEVEHKAKQGFHGKKNHAEIKFNGNELSRKKITDWARIYPQGGHELRDTLPCVTLSKDGKMKR